MGTTTRSGVGSILNARAQIALQKRQLEMENEHKAFERQVMTQQIQDRDAAMRARNRAMIKSRVRRGPMSTFRITMCNVGGGEAREIVLCSSRLDGVPWQLRGDWAAAAAKPIPSLTAGGEKTMRVLMSAQDPPSCRLEAEWMDPDGSRQSIQQDVVIS